MFWAFGPTPGAPKKKDIFSKMKLIKNFAGYRRLSLSRPPVPTVARVALNMRPVFAAWGGGNQWLLQIVRYLHYCGYSIRYDLKEEVDCILINHSGISGKLTFGVEEIEAYKKRFPNVRVLHRINDNDIRKQTDLMDSMLARFNAVADHTVFISEWLRAHHGAKWFDSNRSFTNILNGADPSVFHPVGNRLWKKGEPFRLVTHHWSDNLMKGFPQYVELDERIASGELQGLELWIIGRWPKQIKWKAARAFGPAHGADLAGLLRQCHGYITASLHEPGGMHFIEGLQCGLPLLFHVDGGGIVELGQRYGVGFTNATLAAGLEQLVARYSELREAVLSDPPSGDGMCIAYRKIVQHLLATR